MNLLKKCETSCGRPNLLLNNILRQSYGNAADMQGEDEGLPAFFKDNNKHAEYTPCAGHSLNLVGEKTASTVLEVVDNFSIFKKLHVSF
jgi:hypothetical protein